MEGHLKFGLQFPRKYLLKFAHKICSIYFWYENENSFVSWIKGSIQDDLQKNCKHVLYVKNAWPASSRG